MTTSKSHSASAIALALVMLSLVIASVHAQDSQDAATSAISEAEQALKSGYEAVLNAEAAGGNVTNLLAGLNNAAAMLVDARRAFNETRFEEAKDLAESASAAGNVVQNYARTLEIEAAQANATRTTRYLIASFVAVPLVLIASFLGYRRFTQWYHQRLLKMKPEVGKA